MTETALDRAHAAMSGGGDAARLRFYDRLADAELFLLLRGEARGDEIAPDLCDTSDGRFALAFDTEARMTGFTGAAVPYAALSGRALARMLAGQGIGLGLNFGAPSETLLPAEAVDWLADTLGAGPAAIEDRPIAFAAPFGVPEALLAALDAKLVGAAGLARCTYLVSATYAPARPGHLLAFIEAPAAAEPALARAISEALIFSGIEAAELDVAFFAASDPIAARLARVGLRIDLPR